MPLTQLVHARPLAMTLILLTLAVIFSTSKAAYASNEASVPDTASKLDDYLQRANQQGFSGAVLVMQGNELILNKGYGYANQAEQQLNTPYTVFDIGSVTKQFTAAAVLKLAEMGKLKTSDTLSRFFDDLPDDKAAITLHQLLTHSSGLVANIGRGDFYHIPTDAYFHQLFNAPLSFQPGTSFDYSNAGYSVLARVIELVGQQPYETFLRTHLFQPAGMKHTGYLLPNWQQLTQANGYRYGVLDIGSMATRYQNDGKVAWALKGNGGINSTLGDMYLWYQALSQHKVLTAASLTKLTTGYIAEGPDARSHYAYGWAIFTSPRNTKVIVHNGSNGTFYFDFFWLPEENTLILFATNALRQGLMRIPMELEQLLFDPSYKPNPLPQDLAVDILDAALTSDQDTASRVAALKAEFASRIDNKRTLNRLGLALVDAKRFLPAIVVLTLNVELYPQDGNLWDSLGEAYFKAGHWQQAQDSFRQSIALKPEDTPCYWCDNATQRLSEIPPQEDTH